MEMVKKKYNNADEFKADMDIAKTKLGLIKKRNHNRNGIALIKDEGFLNDVIEPIKLKYCTKCEGYKNINEFSIHNNTSRNQEGLQSFCKKCNGKHRDNMTVAIYMMSFKSALSDYLIEYFGQTTQAETRRNNHLSKLRTGTHSNKALQTEFNELVEKNGLEQAEKIVKFEIVEEISREKKDALIEMSESKKNYFSEFMLYKESEIQEKREKEIQEKGLNIKIVSVQSNQKKTFN